MRDPAHMMQGEVIAILIDFVPLLPARGFFWV